MRILLLSSLLLAACSSSKSGCPSPFMKCGTTCTAVNVDPANCGACGNACAAGQRCAAGSCTLSCPEGSMACGTVCSAVATDNANCGACGMQCPAGQVCSAGKCGADCTSGYADCSTYCADTANDSQNCGACGHACPAGQRCASGACTDSCSSGRTSCGGSCVDLMSDAAHCGACDTPCPTGEACQAGVCNCGWNTLSLGRLQTCALRGDGKVVCMGALNNSCNGAQSDDGTQSCNKGPTVGASAPWVVFDSAKSFGAGDAYDCILKSDNSVWCAGSNLNNRLGNGEVMPLPKATPVPVVVSPSPSPLNGVAQLSVGSQHACALKTNGEVWCWGDNRAAELGIGNTTAMPFAVPVTLPGALTGIKKVVAGSYHTCVIDGANSVWCWGLNDVNQCGTTNASPQLTPTQLPSLGSVVDLVTHWNHTCALKSDKTVWCWGANNEDQIGIPREQLTPVPSPSPVPGVSDVVEIATGPGHTCVRKSDNSVWCWGFNGHGVLGNNTSDENYGPDASSNNSNLANNYSRTSSSGFPSPAPVAVLTAAGTPLVAKAIAVSQGHSCALVGASNHPWCWGNNIKGQSGLAVAQSSVAMPIFSCGP